MIRLNYYITNKEHREAVQTFFRKINHEDFFKTVKISASKNEIEIDPEGVEFSIGESYKSSNVRISSRIDINQILSVEYRVLSNKCNIVFHICGFNIKKSIDLCVTLFETLGLEEGIRKEIEKFLMSFYIDEKEFDSLKRQQNSLNNKVELLYSTLQKTYNMCD